MSPLRPRHDNDEAPVLLPRVVITVIEAGALDVTVDDTPFPPPQDGTEWTRTTFGALLDAITEDWTIAVRIEVRETDGTVFTDLVHARRSTRSKPAETDTSEPRGKHSKGKRGKRPEWVEVSAEGFVPGEDVAVAIIVSHTDATGAGHARALVETAQVKSVLGDGTGEVILFGRVSGTLRVRRLP